MSTAGRTEGGAPADVKVLGVRATPGWVAWLDRAARHCRTDKAKLIDAAAAEYVKRFGFDEPPPPRVP